jgi:hypothetical protein
MGFIETCFFSYEDLQKNHSVVYVAGGAAQNAARSAQVRPTLVIVQNA